MSIDCNIKVFNLNILVDWSPWDKMCISENKILEKRATTCFLLSLPSFFILMYNDIKIAHLL